MTKLLKFDKTCISWIALVKTFRMIYNSTGFSDVRIFHCFCNDIIMTSFLVTWYSKLHILWNLPKAISLQNFQFCRYSGSSFTEGLQKHNDDVMMTSFHIFRIQNFNIFLKLVISYQSAKFQIPQLSESNFTEVFIRHPKIPL